MSRRKPKKLIEAIETTETDKQKSAYLERIAKLERIVELQAEQLAQAQTRRFTLPTKGKKSTKGKGSFVRLAIPDTHGCCVDTDAIAAVFTDIETLKPAEIIMLGDHLECGGFLAEHHTLGYVAQSEYTFEDDVGACNQLLDKFQHLAPQARIEYIEGNHERRIETWCVTKALRNSKDAEYLRSMFGTESVLSLASRGINFIRQGKFYDGLPVPATIQRGKCYYTHGQFTGQHAASQHVKRYGGNIVYGHTHRADSYVIRTVHAGVIGGWSPGCLCVLQPLWCHTNPTEWSHGYGLQIVNEDGSFLHINVPIIAGRSYLSTLLERAA